MSIKRSYVVYLSILAVGFMLSYPTFADDVVDQINITVPVSCTMSGTGMSSHNAEIQNGTFNSAIGETTIKAFCNDTGGFAVYAIGYTDNEEGNNVLTNSTLGSTYDIITGTATSGSTSNWAMKLSTVSSPTPTYPIAIQNSYDSFQQVPDDYALVAKRTTGTDTGQSAEGSTLKTTYQAFVSKTQPAGTYTGQVKFTLIHPNDANLPVTCNPNATSILQAKCLQDFAGPYSDQIIASMTAETQYALKDKRDGKIYTIAKFQVGNPDNYDVWMTQNLDLDLDASATYTNLDTDIGFNSSTNSYETASWSPERSTYTSDITSWGLDDGSEDFEGNFTRQESYDPGDLYWNGYSDNTAINWPTYWDSCNYSSSTSSWSCNENINPVSIYTSNNGIPQYHLGNYYNWTAAIATNDSSSITTSGQLIGQSICPTGWTLPKSGTGNDTVYSLWHQYNFDQESTWGDEKLWESPIYFNPSGDYRGILYGVGVDGFLWSTSAESPSGARGALAVIDGEVYAEDVDLRSSGRSIRCIVR